METALAHRVYRMSFNDFLLVFCLTRTDLPFLIKYNYIKQPSSSIVTYIAYCRQVFGVVCLFLLWIDCSISQWSYLASQDGSYIRSSESHCFICALLPKCEEYVYEFTCMHTKYSIIYIYIRKVEWAYSAIDHFTFKSFIFQLDGFFGGDIFCLN